MSPKLISYKLLKLAAYIDGENNPSRSLVSYELNKICKMVISASDEDEVAKKAALMKWLARTTKSIEGLSEHTYIVGGAPRNFLLGKPIKDIDIVIDSIRSRYDSKALGELLASKINTATSVVPNKFGVTILTVSGDWILDGLNMKGEVIEIANARKETYGDDSEKPETVEPTTIEDDLKRREFTFNTLLWRLNSLAEGPEKAEILDLTGKGKADLESGIMDTPIDPDVTFSDDPSRMLRAIKFITKYNFKIREDEERNVLESIKRNKNKLEKMEPANMANILKRDILEGPNPERSIELLKELELVDGIRHVLSKSEDHKIKALKKTIEGIVKGAPAYMLPKYMELGWGLDTPIDWLNSDQKKRFMDIIAIYGEDKEAAEVFYQRLLKPKVSPIFTKYIKIPGPKKNEITKAARQLLLDDPYITDEKLVEKLDDLAASFNNQ